MTQLTDMVTDTNVTAKTSADPVMVVGATNLIVML